MKICIISSVPLGHGGWTKWIYEVSLRLRKFYSDEIVIMIPVRSRTSPFYNKFLKIGEVYEYAMRWSIRYLFKMMPVFFRDADITYVSYGEPIVGNDLAILFKRLLSKAKIVHGIHFPLVIEHPHKLSHILHNVMRLTTIPLMHKCPVHILNRDAVRLLKKIHVKYFWIPNGVDTKTYKEKRKYEIFTIFYRGANYQKGTDLLPEIIHYIMKKCSYRVRFIVLGRGHLDYILKSLKKKYGEENVSYAEYLNESTLVEYLAKSHLYLSLSRFEGLSLLTLEALACGTPVISYNVSGNRDLIIDNYNGWLVQSFETKSIADKIYEVYRLWKEDPCEYYIYSRNARSSVLKYDWNRIVEKIREMFENVILS